MAASFTDLMASLMVIFVLLFVATVNNATASRKKVQDDLITVLRKDLAVRLGDSTLIRTDERDPFAVVIVMPDSLLFERGSAQIQRGGQSFLSDAAPILSDILCADQMRGYIDNVVVEGHTDTTYAGFQRTPDYGRAGNMRLSQARSMEVVTTSLDSLATRRPDALDCFRRMLSASGRGQEEPLIGISGDDSRQRRVVFKIRVKADLARQLTGSVSKTGRVEFRQ
jgi:flagellar motor protein MotB